MSENLTDKLTSKKWTSRRIIFTVLFTAISIGINYLGSFLAGLIAFPLYLDSVMTIAVTALCGLVPSLICAFGSNLLLFIFAHTGIFFSACHLSTALIAWMVFAHERKTLGNTRAFHRRKYTFRRQLYVGWIFSRNQQFNYRRHNFNFCLWCKHINSAG